MNQFAGVLTSASGRSPRALDTQAEGTRRGRLQPALHRARGRGGGDGLVPGRRRRRRCGLGPDGKEVPAQLTARTGKVLFLAQGAVGRASRFTTCGRPGPPRRRRWRVTSSSLENAPLPGSRSTATATSPASSTRPSKKETAVGPDASPSRPTMPQRLAGLEHRLGGPAAAAARLSSPARRVRIVENGPVRVALEITRESRRLHVRAAHPPRRRRRGQPRGVRQHHRLEDQRGAAEGDLPADRLQPAGHLQLGVGTDPSAATTTREVRGRRPTSGSTSPTRAALRRDRADRLQVRLGQAQTTTRCASRCSTRRPSTPSATPGLIPTRPRRTGATTNSSTAWPATRATGASAQTDWQALRLNQPLVAFASRSTRARWAGVLLAAGQRQPRARAGAQEGGRERRDHRTPGRAGRKVGAGRSRDLPLRGDRGPRDQRRGGALGPRPGGEGRPDGGPAALGNAQLHVEAGPAARKGGGAAIDPGRVAVRPRRGHPGWREVGRRLR